MTPWKGSRWGSMTGLSGSLGGQEDWILHTPPSIPSWDLSLVLRALQQGPFEPLQTAEPKFLSMKTLLLLALASIKRVGDLHAFLFDDSCLEFGGFPDNPEAPARLCAQGSHYSLQRPGGEPASAAPGGGRPSPSFSLSRPSMLRWQDAKLKDIRPALCLLRRPAEGECRLQAEDGPLDSGRHHPGLSGTGCALPVQVESSLYKKCGVLLGTGLRRLADRYL